MTSTMNRPFIALALASAGLVLALGGCSKAEPAPPEPAPSVSADTVSFPEQKDPPGVRLVAVGGDAQQTLTLPGRLGWDEDRTTRVYAPYAGRIERLRVAVGDAVKLGQPLADIVSADIGQAQADLHKAEADLALSRTARDRAKDLSEAGVIAAKELQQADADFARASAEQARAKARLAPYGVGAKGVTQVVSLAARVAGVVVERTGNPGAEVRTDVQGPPLFVISDPGSLWASLDVDETQLALVKPGQKIELRSAAWPDEVFPATITTIGESVDPTSRTIKVRARVPNAARKLKAEMFVSAAIPRPANQLVVPADAVFLRGDRQMVFVARGPGRFERRPVSVRSAGPKQWSVLSGVSKDDRVVVGGGLYLNQLLDSAK
jgi:cobalt-zinc-cadmium efflux system membrane fusion protein